MSYEAITVRRKTRQKNKNMGEMGTRQGMVSICRQNPKEKGEGRLTERKITGKSIRKIVTLGVGSHCSTE